MMISYLRGKVVKAGFPSPANDYLEEPIDLNTILMPHPLSTFLVDCEGDSMKDAFIPDKAKLIIDRSIQPKHGDVIVAVISGEFVVKYYCLTSSGCVLFPANKKYHPIKVTDEMNMIVWGVVTHILINTNDVKCLP